MFSIKFVVLCFCVYGSQSEGPDNNSPADSLLTINDMKLTPEQLTTTRYRNAYIHTKKWTNNIVPYTMSTEIAGDSSRRKAILNAIAWYTNSTCIRWIPRTTEKNYIEFFDGGDGQCYSYVGMIESMVPQKLSIGKRCETALGVVMHEMMHTLGFMHEHMRPDRDNYIRVVTSKIQKDALSQFTKLNPTDTDQQSLGYDYSSMMHYPGTAFSTDGSLTIVTLDKNAQRKIGQRSGFSKCDLEKLNKLYKCTDKLTNDPTCAMSTGPTEIAPDKNYSTTAAPPRVVGECSNDDEVFCRVSKTTCLNQPGQYLSKCKKACDNCDGTKCVDTNLRLMRRTCKTVVVNSCTEMQKMFCPKSCGSC